MQAGTGGKTADVDLATAEDVDGTADVAATADDHVPDGARRSRRTVDGGSSRSRARGTPSPRIVQ